MPTTARQATAVLAVLPGPRLLVARLSRRPTRAASIVTFNERAGGGRPSCMGYPAVSYNAGKATTAANAAHPVEKSCRNQRAEDRTYSPTHTYQRHAYRLYELSHSTEGRRFEELHARRRDRGGCGHSTDCLTTPTQKQTSSLQHGLTG